MPCLNNKFTYIVRHIYALYYYKIHLHREVYLCPVSLPNSAYIVTYIYAHPLIKFTYMVRYIYTLSLTKFTYIVRHIYALS